MHFYKKIIAAALTCLITFPGACPALAEEVSQSDASGTGAVSESETVGGSSVTDTTTSVIDTERPGIIVIDYKDDSDGNDPIYGAEFTFCKVADIVMEAKVWEDPTEVSASGDAVATPEVVGTTEEAESTLTSEGTAQFVSTKAGTTEGTEETQSVGGATYKSLIKGAEITSDVQASEILDAVTKAYKDKVEGGASYTVVTDRSGIATSAEMNQGVYLCVETKAAVEHFTSVPFLVTIPWSDGTLWHYKKTVEPKALTAGDLIIKKTVTGNAGEKTRDFTFKVTFDKTGTYSWTKSDGSTGTVKSGGTVTLRDGQTVTIDTIEAGAKYTVTEVEADTDGYKTISSGSEGHIVYKKPQTAAFTNTKNRTVMKTSTPSSSKSLTNVKTGDTTPVLYFTGMLLFAALVLMAAAFWKRRPETNMSSNGRDGKRDKGRRSL